MFNSNWIFLLAITAVHLGFAALLGNLIQQTRTPKEPSKRKIALFTASACFIAASLSLPLSPGSRGIIWLASAIVMALFGWPVSLVRIHSRWAWHYAGFAMTLILLWSLTQAQPLLSFSLGLSAAAAALLSLRRGLREALGKDL